FWQLAAAAWLQSEPARRGEGDPWSPWQAANGWRAGLPAEADLSLHCGGQRRAVQLRGEPRARLQGEQLSIDIGGVRRGHRAIRRGEVLWLEWQGELREVRRCDPIAEAAGHHAPGGLAAPLNGSVVRL